MSDGYRRNQTWYGNQGGSLLVTPFTSQTTLVAANAKYTVFVQRVHVHCSLGQAATTWSVQGSSGNSLTGLISVSSNVTTVGNTTSIPTQDPIQAEFDFGPYGIALVPGDSLLFVPSQTGASGVITWDGFRKLRTDIPIVP